MKRFSKFLNEAFIFFKMKHSKFLSETLIFFKRSTFLLICIARMPVGAQFSRGIRHVGCILSGVRALQRYVLRLFTCDITRICIV